MDGQRARRTHAGPGGAAPTYAKPKIAMNTNA